MAGVLLMVLLRGERERAAFSKGMSGVVVITSLCIVAALFTFPGGVVPADPEGNQFCVFPPSSHCSGNARLPGGVNCGLW